MSHQYINHDRKPKLRATRKAFVYCDRCEGFGTLLDLFCEIQCDRCDGLGLKTV